MTQFFSKKSIIHKTMQVAGSTMVSRVLGVIRELLTVKYLGAGIASDAFITAFKIPNSLRKMFAEGALSAAFVPAFIAVLRKDEKKAHSLMSWGFIIFEGILLLLCALVMIFAPFVVYLIAPGFSQEQIAYTVPLLRILMPFILFISSGALLAGALQAMGQFFVPAFGPILLNIVFIIGLLICLTFHWPVEVLCFFILFGGFLLFVQHLVAYWQLNFKLGAPTVQARSAFFKLLPRFFVCFLSAGIMEISLFIDTAFGSFLPAGSLSLINYANRFMGIPLGVFAVAFSTILLPHFSRISVYAPKRLNFYILESAKLVFWVTIPCMLGMILFSSKLFLTLFVSNSFSVAQAYEAGQILTVFVSGLFFFSFNKILLNIFYAQHNAFIPSMISIAATLANIMLNFALMQSLQAAGLALATVLSGVMQTILLLYFLEKKFGFHGYKDRFSYFAMRYAVQLTVIGALFYAAYMLLGWLIGAYMPSSVAHFLLDKIGFWLWVLPLALVAALALYSSRKQFGVQLYFLDAQ